MGQAAQRLGIQPWLEDLPCLRRDLAKAGYMGLYLRSQAHPSQRRTRSLQSYSLCREGYSKFVRSDSRCVCQVMETWSRFNGTKQSTDLAHERQ